jgi:hypothetical protein
LDPQLHKSLLQIKKYKGDVEDLSLDFTVAAGEMMGNKPIELFPGGASVNVTNCNRHQYVHLVADHKLNQQIALQCRHFILGFSKVCVALAASRNMLFLDNFAIFEPSCSGCSQRDVARVQPRRNAGFQYFFCCVICEVSFLRVQTVISGKNSGDWDVEDLAAHAKYEGGTASSSTIVKLMKVLREFTPQQRSLFLKFVTSCPRPPLLGFSELQVPALASHFDFHLPFSHHLFTLSSCLLDVPAPPLHLPHSQRARVFLFR